ncbi:MAG: trypsin-like peptidase domain-containing protein [Chloroflexota bacterium]
MTIKRIANAGLGVAATLLLGACSMSATLPVAGRSPSVVQVETAAGLGSGIVYDAQGDIVTNAHVVTGYRSFTVTTGTGAQYPATLVGIDSTHDLAVIHTTATGLVPATFGDSAPSTGTWPSPGR